jgi:hypothetical protein
MAVAANAITANADDPVTVWQQFCEQFNLTHSGAMQPPPAFGGIFL